jgi:hypothetical protein
VTWASNLGNLIADESVVFYLGEILGHLKIIISLYFVNGS